MSDVGAQMDRQKGCPTPLVTPWVVLVGFVGPFIEMVFSCSFRIVRSPTTALPMDCGTYTKMFMNYRECKFADKSLDV